MQNCPFPPESQVDTHQIFVLLLITLFMSTEQQHEKIFNVIFILSLQILFFRKSNQLKHLKKQFIFLSQKYYGLYFAFQKMD